MATPPQPPAGDGQGAETSAASSRDPAPTRKDPGRYASGPAGGHPEPTRRDPGRSVAGPPGNRPEPTRRDPGQPPRLGDTGDRVGADAGTETWQVEPTRRDPFRLRNDADAADPTDDWGGGRLPRELADRFVVRRELTDTGTSEALLFLVRARRGGEDSVLKIYHRGRSPDLRVYQGLGIGSAAAHRHVVRLLETGTCAGRFWERTEYVNGRDLATVLGDYPVGLPVDVVRAVVAQATDALAYLHERGIRHRDVKPANLVLRGGGPIVAASVDVVLVDFGISLVTDSDRVRHPTISGTPRYQAPEVLGGMVSPEGDFWSLGLVVMELATGSPPFGDLPEELVHANVAQRDPDVSVVADERLRLLCRGLLVRDASFRWRETEVRSWLAGDSPWVYAHAPAGGAENGSTGADPNGEPGTGTVDHDPFLFGGQPATDPAELARSLAYRWELARLTFFGAEGDAARAALASRVALRAWLRGFGESAVSARQRDELLGTTVGDAAVAASADVRLLRLLRHLDPALAPVYRGQLVTVSTLPHIARQALSEDPRTAVTIIADLWAHGLLAEMEGGPDSDGLADTHARWVGLNRRFDEVAAATRARYPAAASLDRLASRERVLTYLLLLATASEATRDWLFDQVVRTRRSLRRPVPWFAELVDRADDPVSLLCARLLAYTAEEEVRNVVDGELRRARELAASARYDWFSRQQRPIAAGWAAAAVAVVVVGWTIVIGISDLLPFASATTITVAWTSAVMSMLVLSVVEGGLALTIGGPYHPLYSLLSAMIHRAGAVARYFRPGARDGDGAAPGRGGRVRRGRGGHDDADTRRRDGMRLLRAVGLGVGTLLAATTFVPYLLPLLSAGLHLLSASSRHDRWRRDETVRRQRLAMAERERRQRRAARLAAAGADPAQS